MNKLKIGVIGCGNWGKNIVHNLLELNVLNKVYDANKVSLQNLPISDSYKSQKIEDIIENETIDAFNSEHLRKITVDGDPAEEGINMLIGTGVDGCVWHRGGF